MSDVSPPKFSISIYDYSVEDTLELARSAEQFGYDALWLGEHYFVPQSFESTHPAVASGNTGTERSILSPQTLLYDPWFTLGAISGATKKLRVGTAINIVPLNNPLFLARATVTAHDMSAGRFLFGVGAGWLKEEFDVFGVPFNERGSRLDESLEIMRRAWKGGFFNYQGHHFNFGSLQITPHAVNVPMILGGNSKRALKRTALLADGWINSSTITYEDAVDLRSQLEGLRRELGTDGKPFEYFVRPRTFTKDEVTRFIESGFHNIVIWGPSLWPQGPNKTLTDKKDALEQFSETFAFRI